MLHKREGFQSKLHCCTLEELMPKKHFLRDIDTLIDFSFVYDKVSHLYSAFGRPSIDPVIIVKMLLVGYLYGIDSERRLESEIQVNIAYRWFLGIDLDEPVPDHSTFSQLRRRKFNDSRLFEDIFDEIVRKCIETGLVDGSLLLTDSTHVKANVADNLLETITVNRGPTAYMKKLDELALEQGLIEDIGPSKEITVEVAQSITDPDSGMLGRPGKPGGFHYLSHQTVDGHSGIITDVYVTPGNTADNVPHTERLKYQIQKFGFQTKEIGADGGYDSTEVHAEMLLMGIKTYIPHVGRREPYDGSAPFSMVDFIYDAAKDVYVCPNNRELHYKGFQKGKRTKRYKSVVKHCRDCPCRSQCISGKTPIKDLSRPLHQAEFEKQNENNDTPRYHEIMRLRRIWCEGTFAAQKFNHCLSRARMRGIVQVSEQCLLSACALNLKRLANWMKRHESLCLNNPKSFLLSLA